MTTLTADDRALLDEAAQAVVRRRLAVPALMFLEVSAPMNVVSSSMLHMLTPLWSVALPARRLEQLATLLEDRGTIPELMAAIDEAEAARRAAERAERDARPRRRWPWSRRAPDHPIDSERPEDRTT